MLPGQHSRHPPLVVRIGIGVQETDAERVNPVVEEPAGDGHGAFLVKRPQLGSGVIEPPADGLDQVGRHDPVGLDPEVGVAVSIGHGLAGDLEMNSKPSVVMKPSRPILPSRSWLVAIVVPWLTAETADASAPS